MTKKLNKRKKILLIIGFIFFLSFFNLVRGLFNQKEIPDFGDNYYADELGVLSPKTKDLINQTNKSFKDGQEFFVVTVDNLDEDPVDYGVKVFNEYKIGKKGEDNGLLMLLARKRNGKHKIQVITGYGVEGILPDGKIGRIIDETMMDDLKDGNLDEGVQKGFIAFADILKNGESSPYYADQTKENNENNIKENLKEAKIFFIIIGGLTAWLLVSLVGFKKLEKKEDETIESSKEKWNSLSEEELREKYSKVPYDHFEIKNYLINLIFKRMKEKRYSLDELMDLYKDEKIKDMEEIYTDLILYNTYPINLEKANKYFYKYKKLDGEEVFKALLDHSKEKQLDGISKDMRDAIVEIAARSYKESLIKIPYDELIRKINYEEDESFKKEFYKKALAIKTRGISEKELIGLIIKTNTPWLKKVYKKELLLRIRGKDPYEIDRTLLTLKNREIISIYQAEIRRQATFMDRKTREKFYHKSKSKYSKSASSKSSSSGSSSSRSSGGGRSGGGGAGRNF